MRLPAALEALRYRDYTLLWGGQFVSTLGLQMQTVALSWLVYDLTGEAAHLGGIGLARAIPTIVFSLWGGALADQMDRRRLLMVSQSILAVLSALLAAGITFGWASILMLYVFAFITASAGAFDSPARQALIPALVPRERLANALTLNVLSMNTAAVLGPAVGGLVIAHLGAGAAFWIDAASCFVVVGALIAMRTRHVPVSGATRNLAAVIEGLRFVWDRPLLWQLMLIDFLAVLFASRVGLLPVFAEDVLAVGPKGLGLLYSAPSAGAIVGAALFAFMPQPRRPGRTVALAIAAFGVSIALFGISRAFVFALLMLAASGGLDAVSMAMRHTVRQLATPDHLRGRVGALASVFSAGGPRLGEFQAGMLAAAIGARSAMVAGGLACVVMVVTSRWWARQLWAYRGEEFSPVAPPSVSSSKAPSAVGRDR